MAVHSKKAKDIDVYIESHKSCVKGKQKVEIKGKKEKQKIVSTSQCTCMCIM